MPNPNWNKQAAHPRTGGGKDRAGMKGPKGSIKEKPGIRSGVPGKTQPRARNNGVPRLREGTLKRKGV